MSTTIAIIVTTIIVLLATTIPTYIISSKKKTTEADWAIADRSLPIYVVIGTQFASCMGGGVLVAHLGNAYSNGMGVLLYGLLVALPLVCIMSIAKWLRGNNYTTIPEVLRKFTNDNKLVTLIAALMTLIVPYGWVTSQITAFGNIYSGLTGLNYNVICIIFAAVSLLFIMPSGLKTVAWTDFIFSCFMIAMCIVTLVFATNMGGGWSQISAKLNELDPNMLSIGGSLKNNIGTTTALLWIFAVLPGGLTNQIYFQRVCAIDSEKKVNKSLAISALLAFLSFCWAVYMGLSIRSINPNVEGGATAWFMNQLPLPLLALFAALIFATLMSTVSSGVQTAVMNITRDILPIASPNMDDKKTLTISRILSVALMILAILMCLVFTDTLGWLTSTYAFSAATLACPIFVSYALRKKNFITTPGIIAGMLGGIIGCAAGMILKTAVSYAAVGIGVSFVSMMLVCVLTYKKDISHTQVKE
jgi:SSS family solute:Na+ symporter